ncbi:MAG: hypothetical protein IPL61_12110 [Myxococcales bacterium]|nr:hypothetical protein [Myxococcales bacterium]
MIPTIKLSRPLAVESWNLVATVGLAVERQWEPALLRLVSDEGPTTAARVGDHLLGGRKAIAARLLRACAGLGLLVEGPGYTYALTDSGNSAVATGGS